MLDPSERMSRRSPLWCASTRSAAGPIGSVRSGLMRAVTARQSPVVSHLRADVVSEHRFLLTAHHSSASQPDNAVPKPT